VTSAPQSGEALLTPSIWPVIAASAAGPRREGHPLARESSLMGEVLRVEHSPLLEPVVQNVYERSERGSSQGRGRKAERDRDSCPSPLDLEGCRDLPPQQPLHGRSRS
jgi:hypothetical protein